MVDWSGWTGVPTAARYSSMGERQLAGVSPSYARVCLGVAGDPEVIERIDSLPTPKRQPNLLLGAVRLHGGPVDDYDAFRRFVLDRWDDVAATMLARRTQTNEATRCAVLLTALAQLDGPLAIAEVGASAGLCLHLDRYAYRYGSTVVGDSELVLDCEPRGATPMPARIPEVVWRAGLDLDPLDVRSAEDMRWLEALVWPEQTSRFATLRAAIEIARRDPVPVRQGDLTTDLADLVADAPAEATLVVLHSAVLSYLDDDGRAAFRAELAALRRPVVWIANEGPSIVADVPDSRVSGTDGPVPFVLTRDAAPLAFADPHGSWVDWFRPEGPS